jgi:hypothetical protein
MQTIGLPKASKPAPETSHGPLDFELGSLCRDFHCRPASSFPEVIVVLATPLILSTGRRGATLRQSPRLSGDRRAHFRADFKRRFPMRSIAILAACAAVSVGTVPMMVYSQADAQTTQSDTKSMWGKDQEGQLEPDQGRRQGAVGQVDGR